MHTATDIFSYRKYWAHKFGPAPVLPMSRAEMDELGWDSCDIILVTGDAYVDHQQRGVDGPHVLHIIVTVMCQPAGRKQG